MSRRNVARDATSIDDINGLDELLRLWRDRKLTLLSVSEQALCYEQIIKLCKDGYSETVISPRGILMDVTKRDLRSGSMALKEYREFIDRVMDRVNDGSKIMIELNISEAKP